ncbi:hypothetical protein JJV70_20650 [Streptomyces sp. JJ66]|uniref:DUF6191 domain-containing protein n=1 Tax=Streptomyces sp. JJ66 TaxID=2803843 RepID=UPI001C599390|nr:DUF6191 domain-containing protein [Streptomyces sp. JJ66]MBW1604469.1 hypothetical protein [Streptomyces sp. JJ66]
MFGAEELFMPGQQHAEDEKQRLEHTRVEEGSHDPGCGPVDLESGHVLVTVSDQGAAVLPPTPRLEEADEEEGDGEPRGLVL